MWRVPDEIAELTYKPEPRLAQILAVEFDGREAGVAIIKMAGQVVVVNISDGVVEFIQPNTTCIFHACF